MTKKLEEDVAEIKKDVKEHYIVLSEINTTLAVQAEQLKYHIARTDAAEENIEMLRNEVKPLQKHVQIVDVLMKSAVAVSGLVGFIYLVLQLIHLLQKHNA